MAEETINLFEINIDVDAAVKDTKRLKEEVAILKAQTKQAKEEQGEFSEEFIKYNAALKSAQGDLRTQERLTQNIISANVANSGSITELRKQLSVVSKQWADLSQEERENTEEGKKLTAQKLALTNALKKEEKATGDARRNVGNYAESIEDAVSSLGVFGGKAGDAVGGIKAVGLAVRTALGPIGLIIAAIGLIVKAFQRNEKALKGLNEIFAVFKGILDGVFNALQPLVEFISEKLTQAFNDPKQAIKDFAQSLKQNIINRFEGLLELIPALGKSIKLLFQGEFKEAGKVAGDAVAKVALGVEDFTDKVTDFTKTVVAESKKAIAANVALANSQRELLRINKEFELQQLEFQKLAERQRQIRDDESKSIEERIKANKELGRILDEQTQAELRLAQQQLNIAEQRRIAEGNTLEVEEEIYNARIKIAEINERIEGQRSEQLVNENALLKEQKEIQDELYRSKIDAANEAFENEVALLDELQQIEIKSYEDRQAAQADNIFAVLDLERKKLEIQREQEVLYAELIGADVQAVQEKYNKASIELARAERDAKLSLAADFAGNIATIFGENTAVGKAAAVAQTTISTYQAATGAYAALAPIPIVGPGLGIAAAGAAIASGLANVKKILSVKSGLPGEGGKGGSVPSQSTGTGSPIGISQAVTPEIGQGIVTRQTTENNNDIKLQPTLVVDSVTNAQNTQNDIGKTGVI